MQKITVRVLNLFEGKSIIIRGDGNVTTVNQSNRRCVRKVISGVVKINWNETKITPIRSQPGVNSNSPDSSFKRVVLQGDIIAST
jgi:hypothetical protein